MTRLAVLADIHGNLPALEAVIDDLAGQQVDAVVVAGDIINWGPFSAAVLERVHDAGWARIRGNNELYLLDYLSSRAPAEWTPDAFPVLPLLREQVGPRRLNAIAAWPDTISLRFPDAPPIRVVHGSPRSHWEAMYPNSPESELVDMLAGVEEAWVVAGHTHLPMDRRAGRWRVWNPGSVGLPIDGTFDAAYLLLDGSAAGWTPEARSVPWDRERLFTEFERQRFVERCGVVGRLIVEEFRTARIHLHAFVRWRAARFPDAPITADLLDRFREADRWAHTEPAYHVNRDIDIH